MSFFFLKIHKTPACFLLGNYQAHPAWDFDMARMLFNFIEAMPTPVFWKNSPDRSLGKARLRTD